MKIKIYILVFLLVGGSMLFGQQQTVFTNYLVNQYLYNPAYAGVWTELRLMPDIVISG